MVTQSILLLNASYEPLTVVTLARAVKLLLRGRAEAVSDERITRQRRRDAGGAAGAPAQDLRACAASPDAGLDAPRRVRA